MFKGTAVYGESKKKKKNCLESGFLKRSFVFGISSLERHSGWTKLQETA
jgi:hypothetical protein